MTIQQLDTKKVELMIQVNSLVALKNKLYSNMDIESAKSDEEKAIDTEIAAVWSEINSIVVQKRALAKV